MKKIAKFLFVAAIAGLTVISCSKPGANTSSKTQDKDKETTTDKQDPEETTTLAVDGKFGEWTNAKAIAGGDGLLLMKSQMTDKKIFFYIEVDADNLYREDCSYANYLSLYLDCGNGAESLTYWGGEEGCTYELSFQIWLMKSGKAGSMTAWGYDGFSGRGKIDGGVYKGEFCLGRSSDALKQNVINYGAALTSQYVEYPEAGADEGEWVGGDLIGICPEQDEDMALVQMAK